MSPAVDADVPTPMTTPLPLPIPAARNVSPDNLPSPTMSLLPLFPAATRPVSPPPPIVTPLPPNTPFNFRANTAASTPTRDGLLPPPSWVFDRFAEAFTPREQALAACQPHVVLHDLLADALHFGWESGLKKGISLAKAAQQPPIVREFADTEIQTDTPAMVSPSLAVTEDTVLPPVVPSPATSQLCRLVLLVPSVLFNGDLLVHGALTDMLRKSSINSHSSYCYTVASPRYWK
ncbi:hypothetical protein B0H19DRAFT_1250390 [Mycena capillaripes]|nr:hypothetical protein B0H19DRAFT_1250390 [Mycena capillaripes]